MKPQMIKNILIFFILFFFILINCNKKEITEPPQPTSIQTFIPSDTFTATNTLTPTETTTSSITNTATYSFTETETATNTPTSTPTEFIIWEKIYGGNFYDAGFCVKKTNDGNFIIAGTSTNGLTTPFDGFLMKIDNNGELIWQKNYGGNNYEEIYSVVETDDNGFILCGKTNSFGAGGYDAYIVKTDFSGEQEWVRNYGSSNNDYAKSIIKTDSGDYIIVGTTTNDFYKSNIYTIKIDSEGNTKWINSYVNTNNNFGNCIEKTADGNYLIAGNIETGNYDIYLCEIDDDGNTKAIKTYGGTGDDVANSIQRTLDGGFIITGYTTSFGAENRDVYLLKIDSNLNKQWEKRYGGNYDDIGNFALQTEDGGYFITGQTNSYGAGATDVYLLKTDSSGNLLWETTKGGQAEDNGIYISKIDYNMYIITGSFGNYLQGNSDIYIIKLKLSN